MKKLFLLFGLFIFSLTSNAQNKKKSTKAKPRTEIQTPVASQTFKVEGTAEVWNQLLTIISKTNISYQDYMAIQNFIAMQIQSQVQMPKPVVTDTTKH